MPAPLDPVIAQIIPLLPLRDPRIMTPQSAREALRALAASRAAVPPPPVASAEDSKVKGAAGFLAGRVYRVSDDQGERAVSLARRERRRLFPLPRCHGVVLRALSRGQG